MLTKVKKIILLITMLIHAPLFADEYPIKLERVHLRTHDIKSIQRGAKNFVTYCMVCHSLKYLSHDPIAKAAGITLDKMPNENQKWWFGSAPPDLSLIARVHSAEWLYTYLHVFYVDSSRPMQTNNLLMDNVNMPNPFLGVQGEQVLMVKKNSLFGDSPLFSRKLPYYSVLSLQKVGSMTPDNFDAMTKDLVNFLVYASEPKKFTREKMGIWVLLFIAIFFVLLYLLKKQYWRNIK